MQIKFGLKPPQGSTNPLRKFVAFVLTLVMIGLIVMFSAALLVVILVVGTLGGAYLWWKTRELRRHMRSYQQQAAAAKAQQKDAANDGVFEGEVIRVVETHAGK